MQKGQTVTTRLGKGLLLSSSILLFWSPSAKAWWGKYGSKHEAREASRLWVIQGGEVTKTWSTPKKSRSDRIQATTGSAKVKMGGNPLGRMTTNLERAREEMLEN